MLHDTDHTVMFLEESNKSNCSAQPGGPPFSFGNCDFARVQTIDKFSSVVHQLRLCDVPTASKRHDLLGCACLPDANSVVLLVVHHLEFRALVRCLLGVLKVVFVLQRVSKHIRSMVVVQWQGIIWVIFRGLILGLTFKG